MGRIEFDAKFSVNRESKISLTSETQAFVDSIVNVSSSDGAVGHTVFTSSTGPSEATDAKHEAVAHPAPNRFEKGGSEVEGSSEDEFGRPCLNEVVQPIDSPIPPPNDGNMSNPSREEVELRFQLLDQRLESSFDRSNERVANLLDSQQRLQERLERQIESITSLNATARVDFAKDLKAAEKDIADKLENSNKDTVNQIKAENKSLKWTIIGTAIVTVLTIVIGVGAFNATVLSNMVASFETGKSVAEDLAKSSSELNEVTKRQEGIDRARQEETNPANQESSPPDTKSGPSGKR